jgi:hypothetical protein
MDLLSLIVGVALVGFVLWIVTNYVPMPPVIKTTLIVLVALLLVLWVARAVFVLPVVK